SALHRWRTRLVLQRADALTSDAMLLTRAIESFGVDSDRILTVPFGIESARFVGPPLRPPRPVTVISTRRLEPVYDVSTLLAAWGRLSEPERDAAPLRVAGTGSEDAVLRRRGEPLGAMFIGWLSMPDLDRELRAAHVYVSTARSDSTSV